MNAITISSCRHFYSSRHVDEYKLLRARDGATQSFNDCSIDGLSSRSIDRAIRFIGGYDLNGWSFQCAGPGHGFGGIKSRTLATGYFEQIQKAYPSMPEHLAVETACRMEDTGNTSIHHAVAACVRHTQTQYDALLDNDTSKVSARKEIRPTVVFVLSQWKKAE